PPRSTRFPYTTLFRSEGELGEDLGVGIELDPGPATGFLADHLDLAGRLAAGVGLVMKLAVTALDPDVGAAGEGVDNRGAHPVEADRKSTRLNSSHEWN